MRLLKLYLDISGLLLVDYWGREDSALAGVFNHQFLRCTCPES